MCHPSNPLYLNIHCGPVLMFSISFSTSGSSVWGDGRTGIKQKWRHYSEMEAGQQGISAGTLAGLQGTKSYKPQSHGNHSALDIHSSILSLEIHLRRKHPRSHVHRWLEKRSLVSKSREHDKDDNRRVVKVYGNKEEEVVSGLHFYTDYILTVAAFNSKGEGPHSEPHHFRTPEGGQEKHIPITSCRTLTGIYKRCDPTVLTGSDWPQPKIAQQTYFPHPFNILLLQCANTVPRDSTLIYILRNWWPIG